MANGCFSVRTQEVAETHLRARVAAFVAGHGRHDPEAEAAPLAKRRRRRRPMCSVWGRPPILHEFPAHAAKYAESVPVRPAGLAYFQAAASASASAARLK
jgi:hypothetical protein